MDKLYSLLTELIDNDTLTIAFLFVLALLSNSETIMTAVISGYLGYMKGASNDKS